MKFCSTPQSLTLPPKTDYFHFLSVLLRILSCQGGDRERVPPIGMLYFPISLQACTFPGGKKLIAKTAFHPSEKKIKKKLRKILYKYTQTYAMNFDIHAHVTCSEPPILFRFPFFCIFDQCNPSLIKPSHFQTVCIYAAVRIELKGDNTIYFRLVCFLADSVQMTHFKYAISQAKMHGKSRFLA